MWCSPKQHCIDTNGAEHKSTFLVEARRGKKTEKVMRPHSLPVRAYKQPWAEDKDPIAAFNCKFVRLDILSTERKAIGHHMKTPPE